MGFMNILVTGGAGYIGSHTIVVLSESGHNVVILDNFCNSKKSVLNRLTSILNKKLSFVEIDIRDTRLVKKALNDYKIDAVVHFAGLKAVGESTEKPLDYYSNNVQGTISLLQAMQETNIKNLVFSSSATVYGNPQYLPIDENHSKNPTNPYGRSKLHIEEMLEDLVDSDQSWRVVCLRYFNPVGAHESGLIGEDPNGIPNNLMPYIIQVSCGKLPELKIFGNDYPTEDGTGVRDYIHIMDLANGHLAALDYLKYNLGWHAINLGTGVGYSVLTMLQAYEVTSKKNIPYRIVDRRKGDVASCYANVNKAKRELNWISTRTIKDICCDTLKWQSTIYET